MTEETGAALDRSPDYQPEIAFPPYRIHKVDGSRGYIEPLQYIPRRIDFAGWKKAQFDWFRKSDLEVPLIVAAEGSPGKYWREIPSYAGDPKSIPKIPIPTGDAGELKAVIMLEKDRMVIETSRLHHPLWIKVSYHPDWRVEEGDGELYLSSPAFMVLVPHTHRVVLKFDTGGGIYAVGKAMTAAGLIAAAALTLLMRIRKKRGPAASASDISGGRPTANNPWARLTASPAGDITEKSGEKTDGRPIQVLTSCGASPYPKIRPLFWCALALIAAVSLWHRDERDPVLLYNKAVRAFERAETAVGKSAASESAPSSNSNPMGLARNIFLRCMNKYPLSPVTDHAAHHIAISYIRERKWQTLIDFYESFLFDYPDTRIYPEALHELGEAEFNLERPLAAMHRYWEIVAFFPESEWAPRAAARLVELASAEEIFRVAGEYFRHEDFLRAYPLLLALSDQPPSLIQTEAALLCGYSRFYLNQWWDSARLLTGWLNEHLDHPGAPGALVILGQAYLFMGHYSEAAQSLQSALALDPELAGTQPFSAILRTAEDLARPAGEVLPGPD